MQKIKLVESLEGSIFDEDLKAAFIDVGEFALDSVVEVTEPLIESIPILKLLYGLAKTGANIKERFFMKNLIQFLNEFSKENVDAKVKKKFKHKHGEEVSKNVVERIILILDRNIDDKKNSLVAKVFTAFLNEKIDFSEFKELTSVIDRMFVEDLDELQKVFEANGIFDETEINYKTDRLASIGLFTIIRRNSKDYARYEEEIDEDGDTIISIGSSITGEPQKCVGLTEIGLKLTFIIFN